MHFDPEDLNVTSGGHAIQDTVVCRGIWEKVGRRDILHQISLDTDEGQWKGKNTLDCYKSEKATRRP